MLTLIRFLFCMGSYVPLQSTRLCKTSLTMLTLMWFLSGVSSKVGLEVGSRWKRFKHAASTMELHALTGDSVSFKMYSTVPPGSVCWFLILVSKLNFNKPVAVPHSMSIFVPLYSVKRVHVDIAERALKWDPKWEHCYKRLPREVLRNGLWWLPRVITEVGTGRSLIQKLS